MASTTTTNQNDGPAPLPPNIVDLLAKKNKLIRALTDEVKLKDAEIQHLKRRLVEERQQNNALHASLEQHSIHANRSTNEKKRKANEISTLEMPASLEKETSNAATSTTCNEQETSPPATEPPPKKKPAKEKPKKKEKLTKKEERAKKAAEEEQQGWDERMQQLKEFKAKEGHVLVSRNFKENPPLASFVAGLRQRYAKMLKRANGIKWDIAGSCGRLNPERIRQLDELGFVWKVGMESMDVKWNRQYELLKEFKNKHGHTRAINGSKLGSWCDIQRQVYKNTIATTKKKHLATMSGERIAKLQLLGFEWEIQEKDYKKAWEANFQSLLSFKAKHGHCRVPKNPPTKLSNWVKQQRKQYAAATESIPVDKTKRSCPKMTEERMRRLLEVGFEFRIRPKLGEIEEDAIETESHENEATQTQDENVSEPNQTETHHTDVAHLRQTQCGKETQTSESRRTESFETQKYPEQQENTHQTLPPPTRQMPTVHQEDVAREQLQQFMDNQVVAMQTTQTMEQFGNQGHQYQAPWIHQVAQERHQYPYYQEY